MKQTLLAIALCAGMLVMCTTAWADPPASSGMVIRFQDTFATSVGDGRTGIFAVAGLDFDGLRQLCTPECDELGEGCPDFELIDVQDVVNPSDILLFMDNLTGEDLSASVWPILPDTFCNIINSFAPLATGTVDLQGTDNDFFAFAIDHDRANAYGWAFRGDLTTSNDGTARLNAHFRCLFDPPQSNFCTTHVNLK